MPKLKYSSVYLRYLRARLSNFSRPSFWLTGIFLIGILGLVAREYLSTPDILAQIDKKEENQEIVNSANTDTTKNEVETSNEESALSDDDKAIAADIDNVPSLLSDFAQATLSANLDISREESKVNPTNAEPFLEDIINNRNTPNKNESQTTNLAATNNPVSSSTRNPFLSQAQTLLQSNNNNYINNQFSSNNNLIKSPEQTKVISTDDLLTNLNKETIKNQNQLIISPLEAAIQKNGNLNSMNPLLRNVSVSPIYSPNSLPNQYLPSNSPTGYLQPNSQPIMQNSSQPYYSNFNNNFNRVQTAPNVVTQPNSLYNAPPNYGYVQSTSQGTVKPTNPVGYQNYSGYNLQPSNLQPSNLQPSNLQPSNLQQPNQLPPSNLSYPGQLRQYPNGTQR